MDQVFYFWLSVVVIFIFGSVAHFLYDWTKHNKFIGIFAAVNESTWEHIKIALTPSFLWCFCDWFLYGQYHNYFLAKLISFIFIIVFIPAVYYSYRKIVKQSIPLVNILIFFLVILFSQLVFYVVLNLIPVSEAFQYLPCLGILILFVCYLTFTFKPIKNFIFRDPITNRYGFKAHPNIFKSKKKK